MTQSTKLLAGTFFITTILFWLFVLATYETFWEIDGDILYSKTIEVNPETGEKEVYWVGEGIHEELLRTFKKDPKIEYLRSVEEFGPLVIGGRSPKGIVLSPNEIPSDTRFYVFFNRMGGGMCNNEGCIPDIGRVVQCMNGWLAGDDQAESSGGVGLSNTLVKQGKASMVVVSDANEKIIGIYPYHTEADILHILSKFPEYKEALYDCTDEEIPSPPSESVPFESPEEVPELSGAQLQDWAHKAKRTAIIMPDKSIQDSQGQTLYEHYYVPDEKRYRIYRSNYGYFVKKSAESEIDLSFRTIDDALEWMKRKMEERGYTVIGF